MMRPNKKMKTEIADWDSHVHPGNTVAAVRKRAKKARNFPVNTCGLSRHLALAGECLVCSGKYPMFQEEPVQMGTALISAATIIWELRSQIAAHTPPSTTDNMDG